MTKMRRQEHKMLYELGREVSSAERTFVNMPIIASDGEREYRIAGIYRLDDKRLGLDLREMEKDWANR